MSGFWLRESNASGTVWSIIISRLCQSFIWSDDSLVQSIGDHFWSSLWFSNKQHYLSLSRVQSASTHTLDCAARVRFLKPKSGDLISRLYQHPESLQTRCLCGMVRHLVSPGVVNRLGYPSKCGSVIWEGRHTILKRWTGWKTRQWWCTTEVAGV